MPQVKGWKDRERLVRDQRAYYAKMDEVLYEMCADERGTKCQRVYARVYIIGRSYQTRVEAILGRGNPRKEYGPMIRVCEALLNPSSDEDATAVKEFETRLKKLQSFKSRHRPTEESIRLAAEAHSLLCSALESACRRTGHTTKHKPVPRSFASKYLHFHAPIVPIFDSIAEGVLNEGQWGKKARLRPDLVAPISHDPQYWDFLYASAEHG